MKKMSRGLVITAILLTIILIVSSVMTINRWKKFSEEEAIRSEIDAEYDRISQTEAKLFLEWESLQQ